MEMNTQCWSLLHVISANCKEFSGEYFYSVNILFRDIEENFDLFSAISSSQIGFREKFDLWNCKIVFVFSKKLKYI